MDQEEYTYTCPHCGGDASVLLDLSVEEQDFLEDCEVCCRPIRMHYWVMEGVVSDFLAEKAN